MKKLFLFFLLTLTFFACQREEQDDAPTIALVMKTQNNPFFGDMENGAKEAAAKLGINLIVQAAEREVDVEKQMQIIENLIQRKVDAICVSPSGSKEIVPRAAVLGQAQATQAQPFGFQDEIFRSEAAVGAAFSGVDVQIENLGHDSPDFIQEGIRRQWLNVPGQGQRGLRRGQF